MLIIEPDCQNAQFRDQELAGTIVETGEGWSSGLGTFVTKMKAISERFPGQFEIKFYEDLPCVPMYLIGSGAEARRGYFSVFLVEATAHCSHLVLAEGEWLRNMATYFEEKWSRQEEQGAEEPSWVEELDPPDSSLTQEKLIGGNP